MAEINDNKECDRLYKGSKMARVTEAKIFAC